ncbi:MAG: hypothetical protein K0R84_1054 [Clostridia bacterium]|jgi:hypothetical protein|nr:hypothetical protein [Clostridia bacterium]
MKCKTLINILGKYNHRNIAAALNLKPEVIVFISCGRYEEYFENVEQCIKRKLDNIRIEKHVIGELTEAEIKNAIGRYDYEDTFVNLAGGTNLMSILTYKALQGSKASIVYADADNSRILKINDSVEKIADMRRELSVEDLVCSTGAEILKNSVELYDREEFKSLVDYMIGNYDAWKQVKEILRNTRLVKQFEQDHLQIEIITGGLKQNQIKHLDEFLSELLRKNVIKQYRLKYDHAHFSFTSREAKTFIMMAGCWLEALTYRYIKEAKDVKDAISGMLFVWDEAVKVHNELDVVAAVGSHLVCVSCKDTGNYDVNELNELQVYADHLGGNRVTKILVSTERPERKEMTYQRAGEMGIHIVIFDGDATKFRNKLHSILEQEQD